MSEISIDLVWELGDGEMTPENYSNVHKIIFTPKINITGDSAPEWRGNEINSNPEQTLAASLSSCHMKKKKKKKKKMKWPVLSYKDKAIATLGKNSKGQMSVTKLELNPKVEFSEKFKVDLDDMKKVQNRAHRYCFIANSLSDEVEVLIN